VTWGEVNHDTIARMLFHKGEITGGAKLTDGYVKQNSEHSSILDLSKALESGNATLADVKGLKPVLRLPPPRGGYRGAKISFVDGGALGNRGPEIEKLVDRMLPKTKEAK
jgi:large subunit ribosomal protein L30